MRRLRCLLGAVEWKPPAANTVLAFATIVLAFATIALALATCGLVSTTQDAEQRQLRAYVYVGKNNMKADWENNPDGSSTLTISPALQILGATPAADIRPMFYLKIMSAPPPKQFLIGVPDARGGAEAPGQDYGINKESLTITPGDKEALRKGTKIVVGYGRVEYADVFGKQRWTEFCWQFAWENTGAPNNAVLCPEHNDADWSGNRADGGHHIQEASIIFTPPIKIVAAHSPPSAPRPTALPASPSSSPRGFGVPAQPRGW
jgi:hypothetical protein